MTKPKIAVIVGSLRKDSINRKIANALCAASAARLDCSIIEIGGLPLYNEDVDRQPPAQWAEFRAALRQADGVLFVTPEYNRSVPGALKNAIDVGSRPYGQSAWAKKPAAVVSASPGGTGGFGANHHLRQSCVFLDMPMMQQPEAYLGRVNDKSFDGDGGLVEGPLKELLGKIAAAFADWVGLIGAGREMLANDSLGSSGS